MYTQNSKRERGCNKCLEPYLADLSSHAVLTKKSMISDSRAFVWCADRLYTLHSFFRYAWGKRKKESKKKENKKNKNKKNKKKISRSIFSIVRRINGTVRLHGKTTMMFIFCFRAGCHLQLASYGSKHWSQCLSVHHLCVVTYMDVRLLYYWRHPLCGLEWH